MTITTYSELKTAVANWLHRSDLTSLIPDFITLAESRLNRHLRIRAMESSETVTAVVGSSYIALPTGYLEPIGLWNGDEQLRYLNNESLPIYTENGEMDYWTIEGSNLKFDRPADSAYSLTFRMYKSFALSEASPTNWMLTNYPDAYLYGALLEASPFIRDNAQAGVWREYLTNAVEEIRRSDGRHKKLATLSADVTLVSLRGNSSTIFDG